jgi:hypothetical protein
MNTCCVHNRDTGRFFGWFAKRYRKRFARKGLEPSQKHLMKGLTRSGVNGATLRTLVVSVICTSACCKFLSSVGVDLSAKMLEEARAQAQCCKASP